MFFFFGRIEVGSYVVVVKADVTPEKLDEIFHALNITPKHRYNIGTFKGFAADLTDDQLSFFFLSPPLTFIIFLSFSLTNLYLNLFLLKFRKSLRKR